MNLLQLSWVINIYFSIISSALAYLSLPVFLSWEGDRLCRCNEHQIVLTKSVDEICDEHNTVLTDSVDDIYNENKIIMTKPVDKICNEHKITLTKHE